MKRMIMIAGAAAALCAGGWMGYEANQPEMAPADMDMGMEMDPAVMMKMMDKMSQPDTDHHAMLKKMVGTWDMTARFMMEPGTEPEVSKGTTVNKLVLGGRQLMGEVTMDMNFGGAKYAMQGISVMGFDKGTNEFQSIWMDTMSTAQMRQSGEMDGDTLVVTGTSKNPMFGEYTLRNVITFVEGGYDMEFWEKGEMIGPEFMNTGSIEYRRAAD